MKRIFRFGVVVASLLVVGPAAAEEPQWYGYTFPCDGTQDYDASADGATAALRVRVQTGSDDPHGWSLLPSKACASAELMRSISDVLPGQTYRVVARIRTTAPPSVHVGPAPLESTPLSPRARSEVSLGAYAYECSGTPGEVWFCGGGGSPVAEELCSSMACGDPGVIELTKDVTFSDHPWSYLRINVDLRADASTRGIGRASADAQVVVEDLSVTLLP